MPLFSRNSIPKPKIVAAFRGMHVSPAKHSFEKCDRKVWQTDRQTDRRRTKWSLCVAMLHRRHKNVSYYLNISHHCDGRDKISFYAWIFIHFNIYIPCICSAVLFFLSFWHWIESVWFGLLRIYVALAVFQPYRDLEAGDNQSLKIQVARRGIEPGPLAPQAESLTTRPSIEENNKIRIHTFFSFVTRS